MDPTGRYVATGQAMGQSGDRPVVHVWCSSTGTLVTSLPPFHRGPIVHVAFSHDGRRVLSVSAVKMSCVLAVSAVAPTVDATSSHASDKSLCELAVSNVAAELAGGGPSPRTRGSQTEDRSTASRTGSIPAHAGEPYKTEETTE